MFTLRAPTLFVSLSVMCLVFVPDSVKSADMRNMQVYYHSLCSCVSKHTRAGLNSVCTRRHVCVCVYMYVSQCVLCICEHACMQFTLPESILMCHLSQFSQYTWISNTRAAYMIVYHLLIISNNPIN